MIAWAATWPWRWRPSGKQSTQIAGTHGSEKTQSRTTILKRAIFYYNERPLLLTQWWLESSVHWVVSINFSSPPSLLLFTTLNGPLPSPPLYPWGSMHPVTPSINTPRPLHPRGKCNKTLFALTGAILQFILMILYQQFCTKKLQ